MSDIVERLREGRMDGTSLRWAVTDIHREAADEIKRLRREVMRLEASLHQWVEDCVTHLKTIMELEGALRRIGLPGAQIVYCRDGHEEALLGTTPAPYSGRTRMTAEEWADAIYEATGWTVGENLAAAIGGMVEAARRDAAGEAERLRAERDWLRETLRRIGLPGKQIVYCRDGHEEAVLHARAALENRA